MNAPLPWLVWAMHRLPQKSESKERLWQLVLCENIKGRNGEDIIWRSLDSEIRRNRIGRFRLGQPGSIKIGKVSSRVKALGPMEARKPTVE